jgi:hypothetical protein
MTRMICLSAVVVLLLRDPQFGSQLLYILEIGGVEYSYYLRLSCAS